MILILLLNDDLIEIEKSNGMSSPNFAVDNYPGLFLHPSIFSLEHSGSA